MVKLEIYRKRSILGGYFFDVDPETVYENFDVDPETVFENILWVEILDGVIYGNIDGEELTVKMDEANYRYIIR